MEKEIQKQIDVIQRGTVEIIEEPGLKMKIENSLKDGKPLRIKYGIDPTSPEIHLGHTVVIKKLKDFQDLGHKILFLLGDFTARIGDPTGRNETRPILSEEEIKNNLQTYKQQISRILDIEKTEFVHNSDWLKNVSLENFIKIASVFTVARLLEREDFSARYKSGKPIFLQEFFYPLLQGYDSVVLNADIEIGATEQKFNLLAGRSLQEFFDQEKQVVITMPILVGTDGKLKMSKTYKNHIPVNTTSEDMFGKIMSIPDDIMEHYWALLTKIPVKEFKEIIETNPRDGKFFLAKTIVSEFFGEREGEEAGLEFDRIFRNRENPTDIPEIKIAKSALKDGRIRIVSVLVSGFNYSNSDAKRLITQKAVKIDGKLVEDFNEYVPDGKIIKYGKGKFAKIKII
ncbi:MAG: tyrosine--tRNA ligase [Candidatus Omnitrophica bacterium]|nr:tyrosine--tRNA ligase [Candidatus Omnitrophota bacterium]